MVDHRSGPGLSYAIGEGLDHSSGQGLFEASVYTCNHCQSVVVINPSRTRERGYCMKCNRNLCDLCYSVKTRTGECLSISKTVDEILESAALAASIKEI